MRDEPLAHIFEQAESLHEARNGECYSKFADRPQLAITAALDDFEAMKFKPHDAIDNRHVL